MPVGGLFRIQSNDGVSFKKRYNPRPAASFYVHHFRSASPPSLGSTSGMPLSSNSATSETIGGAPGPDIASRPAISRIRECVGRLKLIRSSIQSTVVALESLHSEFDDVPPAASSSGCSSIPSSLRSAADLEMAVLVQELMAMREDKADLKRQAYLLEREKKALELIINSQQAQETALKSHINHMQMELDNQESLVSLAFVRP